MKSFTDLTTWQESHKFVLQIFDLSRNFSKDLQFSLKSQIERASISITSNIAEGFGRESFQEKFRFYFIAHGSLVEVQNQLILARDLKQISSSDFNSIAQQAIIAQKLLRGLIKKTKERTS